MRVVHDAIEDGVGVGWIADQIVPFVDGDLTGDDGGSPAVAFFEDFEKVVACCGVERFESPIVEDEQLHAAERPQDAGIAAIAAGEGEIGDADAAQAPFSEHVRLDRQGLERRPIEFFQELPARHAEPTDRPLRSDTARPSGLCPVAVGGGRCRLLK